MLNAIYRDLRHNEYVVVRELDNDAVVLRPLGYGGDYIVKLRDLDLNYILIYEPEQAIIKE